MKKIILTMFLLLITGFVMKNLLNAQVINHNFDTGSNGWTTGGSVGGMTWVRNATSFTGNTSNHWHINPFDDYGSSEGAHLTSSAMDFTGLSSLILEVDVRYNTESSFDGMNLYYSTNGGTTWNLLGTTGTGINWYDSNVDGINDQFTEITADPDGWAGDNFGWETASINLPAALDNASSVLFRFYFGSDGSGVDDGVAMDNFVITVPCSPTATFIQTCNTDLTYSIEVVVNALGGTASGVDITDGTTTYQTNVGIGTYIITGLNGANTIDVFDNADATCIEAEAFLACEICNLPSIPADECVNAPIIDLSSSFIGSTNCSYTVSSGSPSGCGSIDNDSWISFIAGSDSVSLDYEVTDCNGDTDGIQLVVFSGSCGSLTELPGSCINPTGNNVTANWSFTGMTIGATYFIRIDGYAGQLCDYSFTPLFGVVVSPSNDSCSNAIPLACGQIDTASNILATSGDNPTACTGGGTTAKGVWYSFVGDGNTMTISTDNSQTNFDTELNVYTGTCGALVCVAGDDDGGSGTTSVLDIATASGTSYYVYVDGNSTSEGTFEISLTCAVGCSTMDYGTTVTNACSGATINIEQANCSESTEDEQFKFYYYTGPAYGTITIPFGAGTAADLNAANVGLNLIYIGRQDDICTDALPSFSNTNQTCSPINVNIIMLVEDANLDADLDGILDMKTNCAPIEHTISVDPEQLITVVTDDGSTCGTPTVELRAADGTVCSTLTGAVCASNAISFIWNFSSDAIITNLDNTNCSNAPTSISGTINCSNCCDADAGTWD
jgi:hypothetical protein